MSTDSSTAKRRPRNRRSDIEELFALRDREGLTWGQLSARSGIPVGTLTSWQQKLRKEPPKRRAFVEVIPTPPVPPRSADFTLETATGLRIFVPASFDVDALARLLSTVGVAC